MAFSNILVGANSLVSRVNANIDSLFDETEIDIVYEVGPVLKSYVPGRGINGLTAFTKGKGYYLIAKVDLNKALSFLGPVGPGPVTLSINSGTPNQILISWSKFLEDSGSSSVTGQFTVTQNGVSKSLSPNSATYAGNLLSLTATSNFTAGATVTVTYVSGNYNVQDLDGNDAEFFTNEPVLNNL